MNRRVNERNVQVVGTLPKYETAQTCSRGQSPGKSRPASADRVTLDLPHQLFISDKSQKPMQKRTDGVIVGFGWALNPTSKRETISWFRIRRFKTVPAEQLQVLLSRPPLWADRRLERPLSWHPIALSHQ